MSTPIAGLLLSKVTDAASEPEYSLTEPLVVVMAQGGKRLRLGDRQYEYGGGDVLVVTAGVPVTGHYVGVDESTPALGVGVVLRPETVADGRRRAPSRRPHSSALATGPAGRRPARRRRAHGATGRPSRRRRGPRATARTGDRLACAHRSARSRRSPDRCGRQRPHPRESGHRVDPGQLGRTAARRRSGAVVGDQRIGFPPALPTRHAHEPTAVPKRIRLQRHGHLLVAHPGDVAGIGHRVGYGSPSQFNREYRRLFGTPPGQDAARLRTGDVLEPHL